MKKKCPVNANSGWEKPLRNKILIRLVNFVIVNIVVTIIFLFNIIILYNTTGN